MSVRRRRVAAVINRRWGCVIWGVVGAESLSADAPCGFEHLRTSAARSRWNAAESRFMIAEHGVAAKHALDQRLNRTRIGERRSSERIAGVPPFVPGSLDSHGNCRSVAPSELLSSPKMDHRKIQTRRNIMKELITHWLANLLGISLE